MENIENTHIATREKPDPKGRQVKLSVDNLKVSFRTDGGLVQAVRDISFDLYKGETLAIVGESGSGKSVTNRAVMGILAGNAVKEGGEIIYDGQDLMKISEEDFHKIRGDKIAMIFQDPMSSLNPIMRVGKQLTEAMILKGKLSRKQSRHDFNSTLAEVNRCMDKAEGDALTPEKKAYHKTKCSDFDRFEYKHLELENSYNKANEAATDALAEIDDILFRIEKKAYANLHRDITEMLRFAERSFDEYVVRSRAQELKDAIAEVKKTIRVPVVKRAKNFALRLFNRAESREYAFDFDAAFGLITRIKEILSEAVAFSKPNFFAMGYYLTFSGMPLPDMPVPELNVYLRKYLDDNFMLEFREIGERALRFSHARSLDAKRDAIAVIDGLEHVYSRNAIEKYEAKAASKQLIAAVENAIDRLEVIKDNVSYTFASSLKSAIKAYFDGVKLNKKEEKRYAKQAAQYAKKVASGKTPDYELRAKKLVDIDAAREDILHILERIEESYKKDLSASEPDFAARIVDVIDYLKEKASGVVYKVTRSMAKIRALKLLKEVGIPDPAKRLKQYPFEFSGGMRQRIVIAIALSADPDILICDEPTTALDVTIQSQILELINRVKKERQLSVIFITHDLGVVANMADRVAVMYAGKIVEIGTAEDVFYSPAHPYTWALLSSMPDLDTKEKLEAIPGTPPNMIFPPKGDAFAERNKYALKIDFEMQPPMFEISDTHYAATWLLHPSAPKVDPPKSVTDRIARMKAASARRKDNERE